MMMPDWVGLVVPQAIGTAIGAVLAYIAMRIDIAILTGRMIATEKHIGIIESQARAAHDRIDRLNERLNDKH